MLVKNLSKTGKKCRVTFKLPADVNSDTVALTGEFNEWDSAAHPMKQLKDGSFSVSMWLATGRTYRFRYLLGDGRWENDWEADGYLPNEHGTEDSIIDLS